MSVITSLLRMATVEETDAIVNETSFFYFVELQLVDPKAMKSIQTTIFVTLVQASTVLGVASPLLAIRSIYSNAHVRSARKKSYITHERALNEFQKRPTF